jgi:hypothetical protein
MDVNTADSSGASPISVAAYCGHGDAVLALAGLGANVELPDFDGSTPLWKVASNNNASILHILGNTLNANVNTPDCYGMTPLAIAASRGHVGIVRALVDMGAALDTSDVQGQTPLWKAASNGHEDIIVILAAHGARVNTPDESGATALHAAILTPQHRANVIRLLVRRGGQIDCPDNAGHSPLKVALEKRAMDDINSFVLIFALFGADLGCARHMTLARRIVTEFCDAVGFEVSTPESNDFFCAESLYSLSRLMITAAFLFEPIHTDISFQEELILSMRPLINHAVVRHMRGTDIVIRRKQDIVRVAWLVYQSSWDNDALGDGSGSRFCLADKAKRYRDIVCFLLDPDMLRDVLRLRLSCRANCYDSCFPLCAVGESAAYQHLPYNFVERFLTGADEASRFVSTNILCSVVLMRGEGQYENTILNT